MSKKYRLVRTDPGALDLSQVLDDRGRPVMLRKAGDFAVVNAATAQHPLVRRFVGAGLSVEEVSLAPVQAPATPVMDKVPAPPPPPAPEPVPVKATPVVAETVTIVKEPEPVTESAAPSGGDLKNDAPEETVKDEPKTSQKARRKYGR